MDFMVDSDVNADVTVFQATLIDVTDSDFLVESGEEI